jgi:2-polyprenyl-3-methyl-5-hydroxy-6-metoxy-1,4-benzoquinol methylase
VAFIPQSVTKLLDIGCSVGAVGAALKKRQQAKVVGLEYDPEMADIAKENLDVVYSGNAEDFPLEKLREHGPYDGLLFADVLEHLRDPWATLERYASLLSPGGVVIASLPNVRHFTTIRGLLFGAYWPYRDRGVHDRTHLRWFTKRNIEEMFEHANVRIEKLERIYRIIEKPHAYNERFAHRLAIGPLRDLLAYQYYVLARK